MQTFQLFVFFVLPSSTFDELRFFCQNSLGKGVFSLQFSPLVPVVIVVRYFIPKGVAGPLFVVEPHIALDRVDKFFPTSARIEFEVDEQFLFNPPVQGFVNRIVRRLSRPRHGSGDIRILEQLVIGHRCVNRALVGVQNRRFCTPIQHADDLLQPPDILFSVASSVCHLPTQDLFGKHIEVESHFKI